MRFLSNSHPLLTGKLSGSTLLETIVASVIFMIVFSMAMDILTRIVISTQQNSKNLLIESAFHKCERKIKKEGLTAGTQIYTFDWGKIEVVISPYGNNLFQVEMNAIARKKKDMSYHYITTNDTPEE